VTHDVSKIEERLRKGRDRVAGRVVSDQ